MKNFTLKELRNYDGKEGRPAYIAYKGKVYDVTSSFLWKHGRHQAFHEAGKDLTDSLKDAPHGEELVKKFPVVGSLKAGRK